MAAISQSEGRNIRSGDNFEFERVLRSRPHLSVRPSKIKLKVVLLKYLNLVRGRHGVDADVPEVRRGCGQIHAGRGESS